jgi:diguanylate cyclase (GGDEF)-like protein/PAS domain S-box-containing protein
VSTPVQRCRPGATRWARQSGILLGFAGCFSAVIAATLVVGLEDSGNQIWMANGVLLAYLLLAPRWRWLHYLGVGFIAELAGGVLVHPARWRFYVVMAGLNVLEPWVGALLIRRKSTLLPRFTDTRFLSRFLGFGVLTGPVLVGSIFAGTYSLWLGASPWRAFLNWVTTDSLGTAISAPAFVAVLQSRWKVTIGWKTHWFCPLILVATTFGAFAQTRLPALFLLYPVVAMILFRFGLGWAALASLLVAAVGDWYTAQGIGPFAHQQSFTSFGPMWLLQLYIASGLFMIFAASSVMENLRTVERKLQRMVALHTLVTDNSRDAILLVDSSGQPLFASPALEKLTGWCPEEVSNRGFVDMIHPRDLARVRKVILDLRPDADSAIVEHRLRRKDGTYVWVEGSVRRVVDPACRSSSKMLAILRDVSERKAAEEELHHAYHTLETLAATDPLTRLANRRRLDQCLSSEWRRAMRSRHPLSILLLDVDLFKSYNDTYGHLCGDGCLQTIAKLTLRAVARSGDLVARFGGEEFAVVLPNTPNAGAVEVASRIRTLIAGQQIAHAASPLGHLTLSAGCATVVPTMGQDPAMLIQQADEALYKAKRNGRDQVWNANVPEPENMALSHDDAKSEMAAKKELP